MKFNFARLVTTLILVTMLFGCSAKTNTNNTPTTQENVTPDVSTENTKKYNAYIAVLNTVYDNFYTYTDNYIDYFGSDPEFKIPEDTSLTIRSMDSTTLDTALTFADTKPTYENVDNLVKEMQPIYAELTELSTELESYYASKSNVDDNYEKAKQLHPQIVEKCKAFESLFAQFDQNFSVITEQVKTADLERAKKDGYMFSYASMKFLDTLASITDELDRKQIYDDNIATADISNIEPLYTELVADYTDLIEKSKDNDLLIKEGYGTGSLSDKSTIDRFINNATESKASVTEFIQKVKSKESFSEIELSMASIPSITSPDGSVAKLFYYYDEIISSYNNMID